MLLKLSHCVLFLQIFMAHSKNICSRINSKTLWVSKCFTNKVNEHSTLLYLCNVCISAVFICWAHGLWMTFLEWFSFRWHLRWRLTAQFCCSSFANENRIKAPFWSPLCHFPYIWKEDHQVTSTKMKPWEKKLVQQLMQVYVIYTLYPCL